MGLRVLLIAYEFPPLVAAQSLRWYYLANGLAELGHRISVLCPAIAIPGAAPPVFHRNLQIHRCFPGPFIGGLQWLLNRGANPDTPRLSAADRNPDSWQLTAYRGMRRLLDTLWFPDLRTEWYSFGRRTLAKCLRADEYDVIISSHEPGVDILLGLWAKKRDPMIPWILDLADPLVTPYTARWREKAHLALERRALQEADRVLVTTETLIPVLHARHGISTDRFSVLPQGVPDRLPPDPQDPLPELGPGSHGSPHGLHLVFTGSLYPGFRNPQALAEAIRHLEPNPFTLTIVGDTRSCMPFFRGIPQVRFLGKRDHGFCLRLQRQADVLINLGNEQGDQIPGKIYEYLGAGTPILHIRMAESDACERLIAESGAGIVVANRVSEIRAALLDLIEAHRSGTLQSRYSVPEAQRQRYRWSRRAERLQSILQASVHRRAGCGRMET